MWNLHVMANCANCECLHVGHSDFDEPCRQPIITVRKRSLGKVIFSQASVIHSVGWVSNDPQVVMFH